MKPTIDGQRPRALRVRMLHGTAAQLSVYSVNGTPVQSKGTAVLLNYMSTDSIEFMTHLQFPVNPQVLLQLLIEFNDWQFSLVGHITSKRNDDNFTVYNCQLVPEANIRTALEQALGEVLCRMNPDDARLRNMYRIMMKRA